jgi:hypothetical protein
VVYSLKGRSRSAGSMPQPKYPAMFHVLAWVIWFLAGLKRTTTFKLNLSKLGPFGLNRFSASRALVTLEHSRLVSVDRRHGRNPIITILEMEGPAYGAVN